MSNLSTDFLADCGCHIECQPQPCSASWDDLNKCLDITYACVPPCRLSVKFYPCNPEEPANPDDGVKTVNLNPDYQHHPEEQQNNDAPLDGARGVEEQSGRQKGSTHAKPPRYSAADEEAEEIQTCDSRSSGGEALGFHNKKKKIRTGKAKPKSKPKAKDRKYSEVDEDAEASQSSYSRSSGGGIWGR